MDKNFFERGIVEIINSDSLKKRMDGKKLRIKMGLDPTKPDIHLGHAVGLWKLKKLQDAGHKIIFLIGDYTAKIGDPSGKNVTRPVLSDKEIKENAKTYIAQVGKILDTRKIEIRYNSEWFKKMNLADILQLIGKFTVAQIIERDDFSKRLKSGSDIGVHELMYPMMQAYDSVVLKADVEFGGSDQRFNILAGRDLQKKMGQLPQEVFLVKLLVGTDGKEKMSKSLDNYIGITEAPEVMFGKVMSIPDSAIAEYFFLATSLDDSEIKKYLDQLQKGENPRNIKMALAFEIVKLYHNQRLAERAKEQFIQIFSKHELPSDIPEVKIEKGNYNLSVLLVNLGAVSSNSEAKRLIEQGGVKIDEVKISDPKAEIGIIAGMIIQVGKRKFYKIK
jgi:tyrosyl-tRNA synthetase